MGLHGCLSLSHTCHVHPKLQWLLPSSRAQTLPNGHSIRVHPRVVRIHRELQGPHPSQSPATHLRPSERAQRARKIFTKMFRPRSRYSGRARVRGRSQIFLVRSEYLLFSRVVILFSFSWSSETDFECERRGVFPRWCDLALSRALRSATRHPPSSSGHAPWLSHGPSHFRRGQRAEPLAPA
jgi:hypothetical protein